MLTQYRGYPAFEVMFDAGGNLVDPNAQPDAVAYLGTGDGKGIDDLIMISHGLNNDIAEARQLYADFFTAIAGASQKMPKQRKFVVIGLFWLSKKFTDSSFIPGGAAGLADPSALVVSAQLDQFAELFSEDPSTPAKIAHLKALVPVLTEHQRSGRRCSYARFDDSESSI